MRLLSWKWKKKKKAAKLTLEDFPNLHLLKEKVYGNSKLVVVRYEQKKRFFL